MNIGDIIDGRFKIIDIGTYGGKRFKYTMECMTCGGVFSRPKSGLLGKCIKCSKNKFKLSEGEDCWIGTTSNGVEFKFNGDKEVVNYIKQYTWRVSTQGYVINSKGDRLHRVVMKVSNPDVFVNHIGGNRLDCRKENLSISDRKDNSKEKSNCLRNNSGVIGLLARGKYKNRWVGNIKVDDIPLYSKYKSKDEALIDLLIMQRHYGFRHNVSLYSLLNNVSQQRIDEVIDNCERQLNTKANHSIKSINKYELSNCKTFYWVYDDDMKKSPNRFKVDINSIDKVCNGKWFIADDINHDKKYIHGSIVVDGKRKSVRLHRYLLNVLDSQYRMWYVDHINGDSLDNRIDNLCITTALGNGHKSSGKNIATRHIREDGCISYRAKITLGGVTYDKTFYNEQDAELFIQECKDNFIKNRLSFKNKEELDLYIANKEITNGN